MQADPRVVHEPVKRSGSRWRAPSGTRTGQNGAYEIIRKDQLSKAPTVHRRPSWIDEEDPLIGRVLDDRYELRERIGTGGMAAVYRANQLNVDRDVAVKVLSSVYLNDGETLARFETEARIISKLRHPNTLKLIDFGRLEDGRPYLVTELLIGETLEQRLDKGPASAEWTLRILRQICDALAEAHDQRIVHRDLKPQNVFLERVGSEEIVRVLDFGIAKLEATEPRAERGIIFGTPAFMSPEQACGEPVDARSDLYALGVMAYYALTGALPFAADTTAALLMAHVTETPRSIRKLAPHVPLEVERLVLSLLEKNVKHRPASARHVRDEIDRLLHEMASKSADLPAQAQAHQAAIVRATQAAVPRRASIAPRKPQPLRRNDRPRHRAAFGALAAAALSAAIGGYWLYGGRVVAGTEQPAVAEQHVEALMRAEAPAGVRVSALPAAAIAQEQPAKEAVPSGFVDFEVSAN